ncbi:TIGR02391 family protein [Streptomyces sp. NPDC058757]|uniref:TIGR02391 family protein n=1 Tax=unclassified Streptomyces TaxID=2593676 RepID=UPI00368C7B81
MDQIAEPDWAVEQLTNFIVVAESYRRSPNGVATTAAAALALEALGGGRSVDEAILEMAHVVEQIFDRVDPRWRETQTEWFGPQRRWEGHRETAIRARTTILRDAEIREKLGDNAPRLSAGSMHPWAWEGAKSLWQSGHYREAITGAAKKVNAETQNKLGLRNLSEKNLFVQAFSEDAPAVGRPRLRIVPDDGGDTYRNVHRGARALAEACFAGIRNPNSHEADLADLPEHEALEQLAAFSLLARWVDGAAILTAS